MLQTQSRAGIWPQRGLMCGCEFALGDYLLQLGSAVKPLLDLALAPTDRARRETAKPHWRREVSALDASPDCRPREAGDFYDLRYSQYPVH